MYKEGFQYYA